MKERTLVILKPDTLKRKLVGEIIRRIENKGLEIVNISKATLEKALIAEHYKHISHIPEFNDIVDFMTSSPVILLMVEGEKAVAEIRRLMGSTFDANPGTIRGDFALFSSYGANLIHGSGTVDEAVDEIERFGKYFANNC